MKNLVIKNAIEVMERGNDYVVIKVPVGGLIEAKPGKSTHVVTSGTCQVARSDMSIATVQVNAWYK